MATCSFIVVVILGIFWSGESPGQDQLRELANQKFGPLELDEVNHRDSSLVSLGRALFWDERISASRTTACSSCHLPQDWGADRRRFSIRDSGKATGRNSQTVFNAVLQPSLRWLGDRRSPAHQAERSITGSLGNASPEDSVKRLIEAGYEPNFRAAFPNATEPVSVEKFGIAVQAYEETLITPAAFDRFLNGDDQALSDVQKEGLRSFIDVGCANCHDGKLLGGTKMRKFGIADDYWNATGSEQPDAGLFAITNEEDDKFRFRVSMLRNIEKTSPYFHDGSVEDLSRAIDVMASVQLGKELTVDQKRSILSFLKSLTGEIPEHYGPPEKTMKDEFIQYGKMHEAIGQQKDHGRVRLGDLTKRQGLYAVGAVEGLRGEITVIDSQLFVSSVNENRQPEALTQGAADIQATLLVGAYVEGWTEIEVAEDVSPDGFDDYVLSAAKQAHLPVDRPFMFMIEGSFVDVDWHIINGACPLHARLRKLELPANQRPYEEATRRISGRLVGVFAENAVGNLTHPDTTTHRHIVYTEPATKEVRTGHVESGGIQKGAMIRFPKSLAGLKE